jgi:hypothetical protein
MTKFNLLDWCLSVCVRGLGGGGIVCVSPDGNVSEVAILPAMVFYIEAKCPRGCHANIQSG